MSRTSWLGCRVVWIGRSPEARATGEKLPVMARNPELQALGDTTRPLDEVLRRRGRTDVMGGRLEQREPAVEMLRIDRQRQMVGHRRAMVATGHQRDRRPEGAHPLQMRLPIAD